MLSFPNAKINLGLKILSIRQDGYHNIESCLYPIPWHDVLEIVEADEFQFEQTGLSIEGSDASNLVVKAYNLLKTRYSIPSVHIHLHKVIPMGAGLGGGSSDGAFTIKMLNQLFGLKISIKQQKELASELGSDCPFFIENRPALATGTGTQLKNLSLDLSHLYISIIHPGIHVSTSEAYAGVTPIAQENGLEKVLSTKPLPFSKLLNDFEEGVFQKHPEIAKLKEELNLAGAIYSAMSGSGSAVFGLFEEEPHLKSSNGRSTLISKLQLR